MDPKEKEEEIRKAKQRQYEQFLQQQKELQEVAKAQQRAQEVQQLLDATKQPKTAMIVAVDVQGGFSKDGKIPWHYPSDLRWFKHNTEHHICVMGRATYDSLPVKKKAKSILVNRKCFVLTSSPLPRSDAVAVPDINSVYKHLTEEDWNKTIFFIGGAKVYEAALSFVDEVFVTVVNKNMECDRFVPMDHILRAFDQHKIYKNEKDDDIRFLVYTRRPPTAKVA